MINGDREALVGNTFRYYVQAFRQLIIDKHRADYRVGEFLHRIREDRLWERWPRDDRTRPGFRTWEEFCDKDLGYSTSKANALAQNYRKLSVLGLVEDSDTFARCMRLGWSKLNVLLRVVGEDETNLVCWLNDIEGRNLSELQLRARIQEARRTQAQGNANGGNDADTGDDDEPLSPDNPRGYVPYMVRFEDQQALDTFTQAVESIRNRYDASVGMGTAITMMAVQYLATVPSQVEGGAAVEVENLIRIIEAGYGIRLQLVPPERTTVSAETVPAPPRRRSTGE